MVLVRLSVGVVLPPEPWSFAKPAHESNSSPTSAVIAAVDTVSSSAFAFSASHTERSISYRLVNLTAGWRNERWSASLWARNLFDARYYPRGFFFANEPPDWVDKRYLQNGDPRRFGLTVAVDF